MLVVENVSEPVALWLPMVLLLVLARPAATRIAVKGLLVPDPVEVTPESLTEAIVLLLILETVPSKMPLK